MCELACFFIFFYIYIWICLDIFCFLYVWELIDFLGSVASRFASFCWVVGCNSKWPACLDYLPPGQLAVPLMNQQAGKINGEGKLTSLFQDLCHSSRKFEKKCGKWYHHQLSAIKYNFNFYKLNIALT